MSLNTLAVTPSVVKGVKAILSTLQADKTGATVANLVSLYAATATGAPPSGGNGALVQDITVTAPSATSTTTVAFVVTVFKIVGGVYSLIREVAVAAGTGSATAAGATSGKITLNEWLAPGDSISVGTTVTLPVHVSANVAEY